MSRAAPQHIHGFPHPWVLSMGSPIHGSSHPEVPPSMGSPLLPNPSKRRFQQLFQALLASRQAGRFSKQIYQPPHQNCLLLQPPQQSTFYLILCCCLLQLRGFFGFVIISSISKPEISLIVLKVLYLILLSHVFHLSRILSA